MKRLIILVHGTFAPNAPWTKAGSSFRLLMEKHLGKDNIYATPQWDGKNNHKSRIAAAKVLAKIIDELIAENKGFRPVIIAHSHGGNITLYALKLLRWAGPIDIITMATPFLNPSIRNYADNFKYHVLFIPITLGFALLISSGFLFKPATEFAMSVLGVKGFSIASGLIYVAYFVIVVKLIELIGTKLYQFLQSLEGKLPGHITEIIEVTTFNKPHRKQQILAVIDRNDEVRLWFSGLYRIGEIVLSIHDFLIKICRIAIAVGFLAFIAYGIASTINDHNHSTASKNWEEYFLKGLAFAAIFCMSVTLSTFLIPLLLYTIRSNPAVYGWESIVHQMFVKTTPTVTPIDFPNVSLIQYDITKKHASALRHGVYADERVIADICSWLISAPKTE